MRRSSTGGFCWGCLFSWGFYRLNTWSALSSWYYASGWPLLFWVCGFFLWTVSTRPLIVSSASLRSMWIWMMLYTFEVLLLFEFELFTTCWNYSDWACFWTFSAGAFTGVDLPPWLICFLRAFGIFIFWGYGSPAYAKGSFSRGEAPWAPWTAEPALLLLETLLRPLLRRQLFSASLCLREDWRSSFYSSESWRCGFLLMASMDCFTSYDFIMRLSPSLSRPQYGLCGSPGEFNIGV